MTLRGIIKSMPCAPLITRASTVSSGKRSGIPTWKIPRLPLRIMLASSLTIYARNAPSEKIHSSDCGKRVRRKTRLVSTAPTFFNPKFSIPESKYCGSESGCRDPEARAAVSRRAQNTVAAPYAPLGQWVRHCPAPARRYAVRSRARDEVIFQPCRSADHEKRCRNSAIGPEDARRSPVADTGRKRRRLEPPHRSCFRRNPGLEFHTGPSKKHHCCRALGFRHAVEPARQIRRVIGSRRTPPACKCSRSSERFRDSRSRLSISRCCHPCAPTSKDPFRQQQRRH